MSSSLHSSYELHRTRESVDSDLFVIFRSVKNFSFLYSHGPKVLYSRFGKYVEITSAYIRYMKTGAYIIE
jgi:hypothetical protein